MEVVAYAVPAVNNSSNENRCQRNERLCKGKKESGVRVGSKEKRRRIRSSFSLCVSLCFSVSPTDAQLSIH